MENGEGRVGGGGNGFSYGNNITINNFHIYNVQNHRSLFQAPPPSSALDRFLWSANNTQQASHHQRQTPPFGVQQNNIRTSNVPSNIHGSNDYHQDDAPSWPSHAQLNFAHGKLSKIEQAKRDERSSGLANWGKDLELLKKNVPKIDPSYVIKGQWTDEEDRLLMELVNEYGTKKWALLADKMGTRAGKQCRERWHNHLRADIKKEAWSEEEERLLVETHKNSENRWAEIAKKIPGRTENTIKNHWNAERRKLDSRKRGKKSKQNEEYQTTFLQDYIMSYYQKKAAMGTNNDPMSLSTTSSNPGNNVAPTDYGVNNLADVSESVGDQDHRNASPMLNYYVEDDLSDIQSVWRGAYVGSSSAARTPKVGGSGQQVFEGNMLNHYYSGASNSSYVDSDTFIASKEENQRNNLQSTRPDKYLANMFDDAVSSFGTF